jgi:PAS domain S-box-containing protein
MLKFSDIKITKQLMVFLVFFIAVPLLGLSIFFYFQTVKIINDTKNNLSYSATVQKSRFDNILRDYNNRFATIKNDTVFEEAFGYFLSLPNEENRLKVEAVVDKQRLADNSFLDFLILDQNGAVIFSSDKENAGQNYASEAFFTAGQTARGWHAQNLGTKEVSAYLSGPYTVNNQFSGVLALKINFELFLSLRENYQTLTKTGEIQLVEVNSKNEWLSIMPSRFTASQSAIDQFNRQTPISDNNFLEISDYRGREVFLATCLLTEKNWGLVVKVNKNEVFLPLLLLARSIILIFSFLLAFGLILIFYFYLNVTRPLVQLALAAKSIEKGNGNYHMPAESKNEIGVLAKAFKKMTDNLLNSNSGLEEKVYERTLALNKRIAQINHEKAKDDALLSNIGEGLIVTDKKGIITLVNPATVSVFKQKKEAMIGKVFSKIVFLKNSAGRSVPLAKNHPVFDALVGAKKTAGIEFVSERFGGEIFPVALTATPIVLSGRIIGSVVIVRDITKEKEVDRMKSEFISIASHQLRGPIASIKWYGELLEKQKNVFKKESQVFIERINISTQHLISLVDDFLNVSRIESGGLKIEPEIIEPLVLIKNIIEVYRPEIEVKKITVKIKNESRFGKILIDPEIIREVYANLVANAVKYSKKHGEILIRFFDDQANKSLVLEVKDDGVGIAKEEQEKIFVKFFRARNALEGGYKGTGLGLYTAQMLAGKISGKIWFASEKEKGSTFWVKLPVKT